jgi:hypothetical protein
MKISMREARTMITAKTIQSKTHRTMTRWAGIFYILATAAPICTYPFIGLLFGELPPDFLAQISINETQVIIGGLIELVYALAVIGIIVTLHPILKLQHPGLSLGFSSLRFMEAICVMIHSIILFCMISLSGVLAGTNSIDLQLLGELLLAARDWLFLVGSGIIWSISAIILNALLYQNQLLPRWVSAWGLIGAALSLIAYSLQFFGIYLSELLYLPIGLQEMVFAGWLIAKGLNIQEKNLIKP